jgi:hypothetical protein
MAIVGSQSSPGSTAPLPHSAVSIADEVDPSPEEPAAELEDSPPSLELLPSVFVVSPSVVAIAIAPPLESET